MKDTEWYVVEADVGLYGKSLLLDDRNRPELNGKPAFRAFVSKVNQLFNYIINECISRCRLVLTADWRLRLPKDGMNDLPTKETND